MNWLMQWMETVTWGQVLIALLIFLVTSVSGFAVVTFVLVKLPANYFHSSHAREFLTDKNPAYRWAGIIAKNFLGILLIISGVALSLPGVPGPGLLTILLGLMLVDFPGKRGLESRIVGQPKVQSSINKLRARFDKPPLIVD